MLLYRDPLFLEHDPGAGHPEHPGRFARVEAWLDTEPLPGLRRQPTRAATRAQAARVHGEGYLALLESTADKPRVQLDPDTATSARSWEVTLHAAGASLDACERVCSGEARHAFVLARPPGHHAEAGSALGFCLLNHVAVAAAHAVHELGLRRVLVLDPDVHHGNGTQHLFEDCAEVLYVSSHRYPFYPGTGWYEEIGRGEGEGYTINLPVEAGAGDGDLLHLWSEVVDPVVRAWNPELILVSAGFDAWHADPLGGLRVSAAGFSALWSLFHAWAEHSCPGRLVSVLEGGYDPDGVTAGVRAALEQGTGARAPVLGVTDAPSTNAREMAARLRDHLSFRWPVFGRPSAQ